MNADKSITNEERANFLRKLDASDLVVTDWEADFIESFLRAYRWYMWFTKGRIQATDRMWMKYGPDLGMPFPVETSAAVKFPAADTDGCEFLVMNESPRQIRCNEPATKMRRNGFRYCDAHAEAVCIAATRRGAKMDLVPFNPKDTKE